jgi:carboxyl-terminal processing protease
LAVRDKSSGEPTYEFSDDKHIAMPMIVIQNSSTAGVAEVFAASLRDNGYARIVGEQSKGNGVGQRDIPLSDGTAIRLSTYEYITPSGERFNGIGIEPNYISYLDSDKATRFEELTDEEDDQLQVAIERINELMGM